MPPKILLLHSGNESFVKLDEEILNTSFEVQDFFVQHKFPASFFDYWNGINQADAVFCWFASWNSFWALLIARVMQKGSILVIGGYDLANLPEANYGHQRSGVMRWVSRLSMKLATCLITNSYYSQAEAQLNAGVPSGQVHVIYHGVPDPFPGMPAMPKERMALTVGKVDWPNLKRKGLEPFVHAAAYLPDVKFVLVGAWADNSIDYLRSIAPENVFFAGQVDKDALNNYYLRASAYVQASLHEGFGLSVAEAMLAGCIPVATQAGSLPEVVGECGLYCNSQDPEELAQMVAKALSGSLQLGQVARQRILQHFSVGQRQRLLQDLLQSVLRIDDAK